MLTLGILALCRLDLKVPYEQRRTFCCHICALSSSPCLWGIRNFHKTQIHSAQGSLGQLLLENPRSEGMSVRAHVLEEQGRSTTYLEAVEAPALTSVLVQEVQ